MYFLLSFDLISIHTEKNKRDTSSCYTHTHTHTKVVKFDGNCMFSYILSYRFARQISQRSFLFGMTLSCLFCELSRRGWKSRLLLYIGFIYMLSCLSVQTHFHMKSTYTEKEMIGSEQQCIQFDFRLLIVSASRRIVQLDPFDCSFYWRNRTC